MEDRTINLSLPKKMLNILLEKYENDELRKIWNEWNNQYQNLKKKNELLEAKLEEKYHKSLIVQGIFKNEEKFSRYTKLLTWLVMINCAIDILTK